MKPLTLQEACNILGIDNATLYRWLQRANIKPETDIHDKRRHTISHAQLTHLARLHHRMLPEKTKEAHPREETIDLLVRIESLETAVRGLQEGLQRLEEQLERKSNELKPLASNKPKILRPPDASYEAGTSGALPDGLVALSDFIQGHHVPETTAKRAVSGGSLPTLVGKWKRGRNYITHALDARCRSAFYQRYHQEPYFTQCPECPHEQV